MLLNYEYAVKTSADLKYAFELAGILTDPFIGICNKTLDCQIMEGSNFEFNCIFIFKVPLCETYATPYGN